MESVIKDRRDSVYIEAAYHPLYKELTEGPDAPFKTMKDVFMTAVMLGCRADITKQLEKRHMIFKMSAFSPSDDIPILRAVALGPTGDVEAMLSENTMLTRAEEYANAGFATLRAEVIDRPGIPINNLVLLIHRLTEPHPGNEDVAAGE